MVKLSPNPVTPVKSTSLLLSLLAFGAFTIISCSSSSKAQEDSNKLSTEDPCLTKGASAYWATTYCQQRGNTTDKHNRKFQACVEELQSKTKDLDECPKREYIKKRICQHLVDLNYIQEGVHTCFANPLHDAEWGAQK